MNVFSMQQVRDVFIIYLYIYICDLLILNTSQHPQTVISISHLYQYFCNTPVWCIMFV